MTKELESMTAEVATDTCLAARKRVLEFQLCEQRQPKRRRLAAISSSGSTPMDQPPPSLDEAPRPASGSKRPLSKHDAAGHLLFRYGNLVWCNRCGAYGERRARKLHSSCAGEAVGTAASRLRLLQAGFHPRTGRQLGVAATRVCGE